MTVSDREGTGIIEAIVVLVLVLGLSTIMLTFTARQRRVQEDLSVRLETLASVRITRHVLRRDASVGVTARDVPAVGDDSLALRVFRGFAAPCVPTAHPTLVVATEGMRLPDPEKDSVLALWRDGRWTALGLGAVVEAEPAACVLPGTAQQWTLTGKMDGAPLLLRYFERGSYHLSGGALRYRRGHAGRQPLTGEVFSTSRPGFQSDELGVTVELVGGEDTGPWRFRLSPGGE